MAQTLPKRFIDVAATPPHIKGVGEALREAFRAPDTGSSKGFEALLLCLQGPGR
jgi:hypothetical protein